MLAVRMSGVVYRSQQAPISTHTLSPRASGRRLWVECRIPERAPAVTMGETHRCSLPASSIARDAAAATALSLPPSATASSAAAMPASVIAAARRW